MIELAQRDQVTIYCISTQAFGFTNESDDNLVKLATETGGRVFIRWMKSIAIRMAISLNPPMTGTMP